MPRLVYLLLLLGLVGCSEYDLGEQADVSVPGEDAQVQVSPDAVAAGTCGEEAAATVTVQSVGTGDLVVQSAVVTSGDWQVDPVALPATLAPEDSLAIGVRGTGNGELELRTNDGERPRVVVPLSTVSGAMPDVVIVAPEPDATLDLGSVTQLRATVVDVDGDPSDLEVAWSSSVDGPIGVSPVDANGASTFTWVSRGRTAGAHEITATAANACGDGSATVEVCAQGGYLEEDLDLEGWHFEGSASWDTANGWLQITPLAQYQVGSAFETRQTVRGNDVVVSFRMFVGDGTGADGMSVTVLDSSRMTTFLGGDGCGLGFGVGGCQTFGTGLPGYSVEFDTYYNSEVDPTEEDHVAFYVDGDLTNIIAWAPAPNLEGTGWHDVEVRVQEPAVEVIIDGQTVISTFLTGSVNFDFPAHVGFTAGTGYFHNLHLVDELAVEQLVCP